VAEAADRKKFGRALQDGDDERLKEGHGIQKTENGRQRTEDAYQILKKQQSNLLSLIRRPLSVVRLLRCKFITVKKRTRQLKIFIEC